MTALSDLQAAAIAYAVSQGYTLTAPPAPSPSPTPSPTPPPAPSGALFDGRASQHPSLTAQTAIGSQKPWSGLIFASDGITIVSHPRWVSAYLVKTGPGYVFAPGSSTNTRSELATNRPGTDGQTDYYSDSLDIPAGFTPAAAGGWGLLFQLGYPHRSGPPFGIDVTSAGLGVNRDAGLLTIVNGYPKGAIQERSYDDPFLSLSAMRGHTLDFVLGAKWVGSASDPDNTSGFLSVDLRIDQGAWSTVYSRTNTTTQQWLSGQGFPSTWDDKSGAYIGPTLPSTQHTRRGLMRFADKASAIASLG